jgi:hypothetical protein
MTPFFLFLRPDTNNCPSKAPASISSTTPSQANTSKHGMSSSASHSPENSRLTNPGQTQEFLQAARPKEGMRPSQSQTMNTPNFSHNHSARASTPNSSASSVTPKTPSPPRSTRRPASPAFPARIACRATRCLQIVRCDHHCSMLPRLRVRLTQSSRSHSACGRILRLDRCLRRRSTRAEPTACHFSTRHAQSEPTEIARRLGSWRENYSRGRWIH